ncbi:Major sperm protein [Trichostrongylus colubriformis]|uniref:Major sperm protein n=1 Tax=Trichostrongylus colubriformis TaxID=6319 RepID=A0AAN8IDQ4_TRICO
MNYDVVTTVRLIFKGLKPGQEAPRKERFTIVAAIAPSAAVDVEKIWKSHKYQEKIIESELGKKRFKILFFGINDQEDDDEDEKKEAEEKKKKGINEGDPDGDDKAKATGAVQKEKIVENVVIKKEIVQAPPKKLVMVMYRDKQDSCSGDDDEDDADATIIKQPAQNSKEVAKTQVPSKAGPPIKLSQPPPGQPAQGPTSTTKTAQQPVNTAKPGPPPPAPPPPPPTAPKSLPPTKGPNAPTAAQQKQIAAMGDDDLMGAKTCRINKNFEQRPAAPVVNK